MKMDIEIDVPEGRRGQWKVEEFEISEESARFENMRASFSPGARHVRAGKFKRLMRGNTLVMSNTPAEISDHRQFIRIAKNCENVLINGLGLGVALKEILTSEKVKSVTVVERSIDVIALIAPTYQEDKRVTIVNADAFDYMPPKGIRFGAVWHDIWDNICSDNLPEMTKLSRKYGRRCDWQGSWCKELCLRFR
jgi:spermidine synthase